VDQTVLHAANALPAHGDDQIAVTLPIEDGLVFDLSVRVADGGERFQYPLDGLAVRSKLLLVYLTYSRMTSFDASKTIRRILRLASTIWPASAWKIAANEEALDLDRDSLVALFRCHEALSPDIDEEVGLSDLECQRVVGDRPSVSLEGVNEGPSSAPTSRAPRGSGSRSLTRCARRLPATMPSCAAPSKATRAMFSRRWATPSAPSPLWVGESCDPVE
jgi:hypothetical protein